MDEDRVTVLLQQWAEGDDEAFRLALSLLYELLRKKVNAQERHRLAGVSVSATSVLHEAYAKVANLTVSKRPEFQSRQKFISYFAVAVRHKVVEHLRFRAAGVHGGGMERMDFEDEHLQSLASSSDDPVLRIALSEAIDRLHEMDPTAAEIFDMRWVLDMSSAEIAAERGITPQAVNKYLRRAYLFIRSELADKSGASKEDSE